MDSRIWSKLPQRLVDRVIAFLPPPSFFRSRCVCKRWYGLLFSNTFLELYLQISPTHNWFLFFNLETHKSYIYSNNNQSRTTCYEGYLFDPCEIKWYRLQFPSIPNGFSPISSSTSLICWVSNNSGPKSLILCNPLLGSITQLPPTLRSRLFPSVGLSITSSSIDVIVAGDDLISPYAVKNLTSETFHIDSGGFFSIWGTSSLLPRLSSFESNKMVYFQGKYYSMNYSPFSILAYDIVANNWSKIQAPMRRFLRSPNLVEGRGKLLMVAFVEKSKLNVPKSLRLWALQVCGGGGGGGGNTWVEIERMPQQLYFQFEQVECGNGFNCIGHGDFVVILIKGCEKALLFDLERKIWNWITPCPYIDDDDDDEDRELHGFAYEPKLSTPVTRLLDQFTCTFPLQSFNGV